MSSIAEIVDLIEKLYSPNPSQEVNQIQQRLQTIQKSHDGFHVANELLKIGSYPSNVNYFGALTLTVQLNTNVNSFETLWKLFRVNLIHLANFCNFYVSNPQVNAQLLTTIKKLMSNLSLIYTNINENEPTASNEDQVSSWNNPLNTLLVLLSQSNNLTNEQWQNFEDPQLEMFLKNSVNAEVQYEQLINFINTNPVYNMILIIFTEIIVEDLTKYQSRKATMTNVYKVLHDHLYITTMALMNYNLTMTQSRDDILYSSINAWISCISVFRNISSHGNMDLTELFSNLITLMCCSSAETDNFVEAEKILSIFTGVFANDPTLINYELRSEIETIFLGVSRKINADTSKNAWMLQYMNHLVTNEMTNELRELAGCIVDFLQINTLDVCNKLFVNIPSQNINPNYLEEYIKVLLQLTNFPLTPVLQEAFSVRMVDFWMDLSESYSNLAPETLSPEAPERAVGIFQQVVSIYLPKISLLIKQKIIDEDGEDSSLHEFEDFRTATSDMIESLWSVLGNDKLTNVLIEGVSNANTSQNSADIDVFQTEAMSFLLNKLLVDMTLSESPWICDIIGSNKMFIQNVIFLFQSGMQSSAQTASSKHLKLDSIRTSSSLLGTLSGYFIQDNSQLSSCVESLFQGLQGCTVNTNDNNKELNEKLETIVIRSIHTIFEVCRKELSSYLDHFLSILSSILKSDSNVSNFTREKLIHSVGYLIQARTSNGPQEQGRYILQLVENITELIKSSGNLPFQQQRDYVHSLLTCISELGSSLIPSDEEEDIEFLKRIHEFEEFWRMDPLQVRNKVTELLDLVLSDPQYQKDSRFAEVCCLIMGKALVVNDGPHFLAYSMTEIMEFVMKHLPNSELSTSLPYYTYLLERMIVKFKETLTPKDIDFMFERFFLSYYQQSIQNDPDLLQTVINFVNCILDLKPSLIIYTKYWDIFILPEFLKLLPSREKFTIFATTKFFTKLINNKRYTQEELQKTSQDVISLGQDITYQTMYGLFNTQRSDLNCYTDLIRALIAKFPMQTKQWLMTALPTICDNNPAHEKLIQKLSVTRGNRAASNVLLEWWLECNSLPSL
ncbi:hypothetical protein Kpol_1032p60 [Vanderwaltozyma polyspora DSM 70294]|uniref:Importin N-terminal domain-containing protein n=1 Tax=Vanderwaltozyma polyspora (strain ATCC 22028 / DSM 70294 / BCRC 21397 / CBS 2163 / NBRC 10782 / NRRL Y-8283 / UCD 57-17) TaxID=436907 RepID=A7TH14_VANPO|nr:uncharacterized protein Kpol_1032p60 [Vanderwaltozyma polyspora DSM 70294]EDO18466.1 hypothetical protein Kpol_1032p60 [Vanderwaltozyma polyspora DSM 70294]